MYGMYSLTECHKHKVQDSDAKVRLIELIGTYLTDVDKIIYISNTIYLMFHVASIDISNLF